MVSDPVISILDQFLSSTTFPKGFFNIPSVLGLPLGHPHMCHSQVPTWWQLLDGIIVSIPLSPVQVLFAG